MTIATRTPCGDPRLRWRRGAARRDPAAHHGLAAATTSAAPAPSACGPPARRRPHWRPAWTRGPSTGSAVSGGDIHRVPGAR
ncbi:hypothetical protein QJS66_02035 [Kocuria rhizophila]|nr:hypothetical protein QJS66_02035 [Kocuria rhizophila]